MIERLAIIGLGLIGGSVAKAARTLELAHEIHAFDACEDTLIQAKTDEVIDHIAISPAEAVKDADFVVIATPLQTIDQVFVDIKPALKSSTVFTDVAGVKKQVVSKAKEVFGVVPHTFVPSHPIAGKETHGYSSATAGLFNKHRVIVTPVPENQKDSIERVEAFWQAMDTDIVRMSPEHHDEILSLTSHLPHLLAFSMMQTMGKSPYGEEIFEYAAGGLRDFTRIAASDPTMWRDISFANQDELLKALNAFIADLSLLRDGLEKGDQSNVLEAYKAGKASRDHFTDILLARHQ